MMDNIREKLVELLDEAYRNAEETCRKTDCENCCVSSKPVNSCVMTLIADNLITNGVQVQEWIPVSERLPKDDSPVLVYKSRHSEAYGNMETAYYWNQRRWMGCIGENVTHWMPLPISPKGE